MLLAYATLAATAFIAATIFPAGSEAVVVAMLIKGASPVMVIVVASVGNVLGAMTTWGVGYWARSRPQIRIPQTAQAWYDRWGRWSLLLSWMPVVGDALVLIAGVMRERASTVFILVSIAKVARYALLAAATLALAG
ncbi:YqaA family protein [Albirhodobacter sp. R86504]|uniref:YqaA family protein n=1 Tax=Albirhodobacter sp. R86504 TaxID=3093848 RepID=UPI00366AAE4C